MSKWQKTRIGQFLKVREEKYSPDDKQLIGLKRLNKINFSGEIHLSDKGSKTDMIIVKPGDLVISGINVAKGAIAVYQGGEPITATIHYSSYMFDENQIDIEYFKRFTKSQSFIQVLEVRGGIKTEIKPKHFLPLEICLPDIDEQKRIASFFKRTESEIKDLNSEISTQSEHLSKLRQAVRQEAIEGKLTAAWRAKHSKLISGDNHASKLLEKIQIERERFNKEYRASRKQSLLPITEKEKPFTIPDGWAWCRLGEIIYGLPRNGYSPKEVSYETQTKSLKLGATTYGIFNPNEFKYVADEIPKDSIFWLEPGDILVQRSNSIDYVGVSAIYTGRSKEFIYPDLMMKIRPVKPLSINLFHTFLSSPTIRMYLRTQAKGSQQTMPKINQGIVMRTVIPLPPLSEQAIIVERVNKLMALIERLDKQVSESKEQAELLTQSVLREAFQYNPS